MYSEVCVYVSGMGGGEGGEERVERGLRGVGEFALGGE